MLKRAVLFVALVAAIMAGEAPQSAMAPASAQKPVKAIGFQVGGGATRLVMAPTGLTPNANGEARVEARSGVTAIELVVKGLDQPTKFGAEFLTYVLWAVSPEGSTYNLGELRLNADGDSRLKTTSQLQAFSLFVTAEPYFAVHLPSEILVLVNDLRKDTKGHVIVVHEYKLMERAQYERLGNPLALTVDLKRVPLEMYEARNATAIAQSHGADRYAPEIFGKVQESLRKAEAAFSQKAFSRDTISAARETVQFAEDALRLAIQRQELERAEEARAAAAAQAKAEAEAKAAQEAAEAKRQADAEAQRQAELAAAREAQLKAEAEVAAMKAKMEADAQAAKAKAEADALAKAKADAERREAQAKADAAAQAAKAADEAAAMKAREEAARADAEKAKADAEALRAQLLDQFSRILETRDTERGLVVNMGDVLFDTGKFDLRPLAREKLARLAGIILSHPGLHLEMEGHTDNTGSDELNMKLSEQRAEAVLSYLVDQGLPQDALAARGFGKTMPVADNTTAEGRQQNRRVEIVISGEIIGTKIGK
jgi:outer membrane protein OmpA-like peptidoglycan-associated protein